MCGGITALGLDSDIDLNQLFDERNVRVILVSDRLLINLSMTQRTQIAALMENPSDFGWTSTDNWLAYRVYSR